MIIHKDIDLKEIDKILLEINKNPNAKISFPLNLDDGGILGIESHLIQLYISYIRNSDSIFDAKSVSINGNKNNNPKTEVSNFLVLLIYIFSLEKVDKEFISQVNSLISNSQESIKEKNKYLESAVFPAIRFLGHTNEYSTSFYTRDNKLYDQKEFEKAINLVLDKIAKNKGYNAKEEMLRKQNIVRINDLVMELFVNTDKHATTDEYGKKYEKNVRAVLFNLALLTSQKLNNWSKSGGGGKSKFLSSLIKYKFGAKEPDFTESQVEVMEISILDGGPGMARNWTGLPREELTIDEEIKAVILCFEKYRSSTSIDSDGLGLWKAMKLVRELRGWFRLRTGHLILEKGFINGEERLRPEKKDFRKSKAFAEGVVFNFVIPLG